MALDGLSAGLLAGFSTMNDYYRGKRADERADKEMGLRDAQWQNTLDRQKVADQRYTDETEYRKGRDSLSDARYDDETKYNREQQVIVNKRADAQLGLQQAQFGLQQKQDQRLQKMHDLEVSAKEKAGWQNDNLPAIKIAVNKYISGQQLTMQEQALLNNPYAARYNPTKLFTPEFTNASRTALNKVREIVGNPDAQNWNPQQLYETINTPEMTKSLGVMFKNDLEDGIGQRTADGSVVSGYASPRIVPTGNGMFAVEADVTYEGPDGKKFTKPAPITVGRGAGGDAEVKQFSANDLIRYFGNAAKASTEANSQQSKIWSVANGLAEGPNNKGYQESVVKLNADTQKNIDRINSDTMMSEQEKSAAVQRERQSLQQQINRMAEVFGVKQGKSAPANASAWAEGDPVKEEWLMKNRPVAEFALSRGDDLDELLAEHVKAGWKPEGFSFGGGNGGNGGNGGGSGKGGKVTQPPRPGSGGDKSYPGDGNSKPKKAPPPSVTDAYSGRKVQFGASGYPTNIPQFRGSNLKEVTDIMDKEINPPGGLTMDRYKGSGIDEYAKRNGFGGYNRQGG